MRPRFDHSEIKYAPEEAAFPSSTKKFYKQIKLHEKALKEVCRRDLIKEKKKRTRSEKKQKQEPPHKSPTQKLELFVSTEKKKSKSSHKTKKSRTKRQHIGTKRALNLEPDNSAVK